jgi:hypothetical protein
MREIHFNNNLEVYEYINDTPLRNYSRDYSGGGFCRYTWDETVEALLYGWPQGAKSVLDISEVITKQLGETEESYAIEYDVTGEYIDMGRYVIGEPECCASAIRDNRLKPVVNITVNLCVVSYTPQEVIERRGGVIMSLIGQLRKHHIVNVYIYEYATGFHSPAHPRHASFFVGFGMNTANDYSRDLLAFYLAHPGALRRICFSIEEKMFKAPNLNSCGYGHPDSWFKPQMPENEKCFHFPAIENSYRDFENTESAVAYVVDRLQEIKQEEEVV